MNAWNTMEDVNIIVRTLLAAIHVYVTVGTYMEGINMSVKVLAI